MTAPTATIPTLDKVTREMDPRKVTQALDRGLRRGMQRSRTEGGREIRKIMPLRARDVNQAFTLRPPRQGRPGVILITSPATPLSELKPRKTRSGFSVEIEKGRRVQIRGAFQIPKAGQRLFRRVGAARLPIGQLFTRSVTQVAEDDRVLSRITAVVDDDSRAEFRRQLLRAFGGMP